MATSQASQQPPSKQAEKKFLESFGKEFGEHALVDTSVPETYDVVSTGSLDLDLAFGVGGWVIGRIGELYGPPGIGKTTLMLYSVAAAQRQYPKRKVAWIDMEGTFDLAWAAQHGVELGDRFFIYTPESAEDVADALKRMIRSGLFVMIVIDSIGAMIAGPELRKHGAALVCINQLRANISGFGKETQTGGGWLLRYCTTHKVELKKSDSDHRAKIDGKDQSVGHPIKAFVERNKVAPPNKTANFSLFHTYSEKFGNPGIDRADEAVTVGLRLKIIGQSGAYYDIPVLGERVNGKDRLLDAVRANPEVIDHIREQGLAILAGDVIVDQDTDPLDEEGEAKEALDLAGLKGSGLFANTTAGSKGD